MFSITPFHTPIPGIEPGPSLGKSDVLTTRPYRYYRTHKIYIYSDLEVSRKPICGLGNRHSAVELRGLLFNFKLFSMIYILLLLAISK